jgi:hypothetical protein
MFKILLVVLMTGLNGSADMHTQTFDDPGACTAVRDWIRAAPVVVGKAGTKWEHVFYAECFPLSTATPTE